MFWKGLCTIDYIFFEKKPNELVNSWTQFGFRQKYSTTLALIRSMDKIRNEDDRDHYGSGIFVDFQLIFTEEIKLEYYEVWGNSNPWFASYFSNRKLYVLMYVCSSNPADIKCGVL